MIKGILINILLIVLGTVLIVSTRMDGNYSRVNVLDASFVVSIIIFFFGLITFSNATEVLKSTGYVLKQMFTPRTKKTYMAYYEYSEMKKQNRDRMTGFPSLLVAGITVIVNIVFSFIEIGN